MKQAARTCLFVVCLAGPLAFCGGCGAGKTYRDGRKAEKRGAAHEAYDTYCRAGRKHPSSRAVASAIKRAAPAAAAFWEAQAKGAEEEGRYTDAWRMWMRTLEIRPDHPTAPDSIRRLQARYPRELAAARQEWRRRGSASLAQAKPRELAANIVGPEESTPPPPTPKPVAVTAPKQPKSEHLAIREEQADVLVAAATAQTTPQERVPPDRPQLSPGPTAAVTQTPAASKPSDSQKQAIAANTETATPKPPPIRKPLPPSDEADKGSRPSESSTKEQQPRRVGEFLVVRTLSKRDRRYPKEARIIDGISVKLKDTDGDLDVDLNLYAGKKRIKKIRELPPGESETFQGISGRQYRLTVLGVHHKTRTVRIGVKPK